MATNRSTCHPGDRIEALNRLPELAEPQLQIDFEQELQQLRREGILGHPALPLARYLGRRLGGSECWQNDR